LVITIFTFHIDTSALKLKIELDACRFILKLKSRTATYISLKFLRLPSDILVYNFLIPCHNLCGHQNVSKFRLNLCDTTAIPSVYYTSPIVCLSEKFRSSTRATPCSSTSKRMDDCATPTHSLSMHAIQILR
jgi:hypothetical protein